jgi:hypothetical protein
MALTYKDAGVDIDAGNALIERIKPLAKGTMRPEVIGGIGGFAALCRIPQAYEQPILVSGTDGVGTKLKTALAAQRHDTIGIDLVAMCASGSGTGLRAVILLGFLCRERQRSPLHRYCGPGLGWLWSGLMRGGGCGGKVRFNRASSRATSRSGSVRRTKSNSRPSIVGTRTSRSCSIASFSNTTAG